ncbi:transcriptional regulator, RpiR family [Granulicatella balaenopterae]|uniref:Transcriptional regulator, RpiR family n=1 Tax=Granulicatella balaenopterae TaxID=137733 RepID=A0A1H9PRE6_9LACT|nr:MurR/RpiR family transcriptional regulator [Granulicatella balaenopterae]SER50385.1 transcriptional regulator, RpiR family [Granulicatella balaenopterae]
MKNPLIHLKEKRTELSPTEKSVCDYILLHPREASTDSIHQLAKESFSSPSTVLRTIKKMGFNGFRQFKNALIIELASQESNFTRHNSAIKKSESTKNTIRKITSLSTTALLETSKLMEVETLDRCVTLIHKSNRLLFFGIGASYCSAKDAYMKFLRINKTCLINEDWHNQLITARNSTPNDLAIIVTYSGHTEEILACVKELKLHHTPIIAITRCIPSPVSDLSDYKLYTTSQEPIVRSGAIASRISQQYITDILYSAYVSVHYDNCLQQLTKTQIIKDKK